MHKEYTFLISVLGIMTCIMTCVTGYGIDLAATNKPLDVTTAVINASDRPKVEVPDLDLDFMLTKPALAPAAKPAANLSTPIPASTNTAVQEGAVAIPVTNVTVSVPVLPAAVDVIAPAHMVEEAVKDGASAAVVRVKAEIVEPVKTVVIVTTAEPQLDAESTAERLQTAACELAAAKAKIMELAPSGRAGKLKQLERKGLEYDSLSSKLELKDQVISRLMMDLKAAQKVITNQVGTISELVASTNELTQAIAKMTDEKAPLKEALDILRLGKYEYYQVEKDDTCESIAAKPSIYNDVSKHSLIRQANKGSVANLDKLVAGEILVIPRVKVSERHDI